MEGHVARNYSSVAACCDVGVRGFVQLGPEPVSGMYSCRRNLYWILSKILNGICKWAIDDHRGTQYKRNDRESYGCDGLSPTWPYNNSIQSPSFAKNKERAYNNEQMDGFDPNPWVHQTPQELSSNPQSPNYTSTNKFFSPPPQQL